MAAHPFGPIENQLIVGYYKKIRLPSQVKPQFTTKEVLLLDHDKFLHEDRETDFYGWSPANGNSSSHDFRVTYSYKLKAPVNLLSRGLGYRITFTMRGEPCVQVELLDLFGGKVFSTMVAEGLDLLALFPQKVTPNAVLGGDNSKEEIFTDLIGDIQAHQTLQLEVTINNIKIVKNDEIFACIPNYNLKASVSSPQVLKVLQRFPGLLGSVSVSGTAAFLSMAELVKGICVQEKWCGKFPPDQVAFLQPQLVGCISLLRKYCIEASSVFSASASDWESLGNSLSHLSVQIGAWADAAEQFPRTDLENTITKLTSRLDLDSSQVSERLLQKLNVRERYFYWQICDAGFGAGSIWLWRLLELDEFRERIEKPRTYFTRNHEIKVSSGISFRQKGHAKAFSPVLLPGLSRKMIEYLGCKIIPRSDRLFVVASKQGVPQSEFYVYLMDLLGIQISITTLRISVFPDEQKLREGTARILHFDVDQQSFHILVVIDDSRLQPNRLQTLELKPTRIFIHSQKLHFVAGEQAHSSHSRFEVSKALNYNKRVDFSSVKLTQNTNQLFVLLGNQSVSLNDYSALDLDCCLICLQVDQESQRASVVGSSRLITRVPGSPTRTVCRLPKARPPQVLELFEFRPAVGAHHDTPTFQAVWLENRYGSVFACVLHGSQLLISCYDAKLKRFVPIGGPSTSGMSLFDRPSLVKSFAVVRNHHKQTGVIGVFSRKGYGPNVQSWRVGILRLNLRSN